MMRTRLKDVAAELKLSPALVSGVLNGRENVWASEETRRRIVTTARQLDYHPNTTAQALSSGKTRNVALVYRRLEGVNYRLAYTGLVDVFSAELQSRGHDLLVCNFATQEEVLDHLRRIANARTCDAVILWGREVDTEPQAELLESLKMPFLVKGRHEKAHPDWFQIDFDHEWMMANAVEKLVSLGHRRLAYIGFPLDEAYVHALRRGYTEAHERLLGHAPDPNLFGNADDTMAANEATISAWLALPKAVRPTAFVLGAGNHAWHALEASLARIGRSLELTPGGYAAAGVASYYFTLMFGEAFAYQGIEIDNLARSSSPGLLDAVFSGKRATAIARLRPEMVPAPTLGLVYSQSASEAQL
ncbi:LacI family transcriptional regulator [bacterium]|nr:MAG: LacI family transcriptional regulator [bacterium]